MPDKLHKTKGIVLRTVKYGETSVIVSIFTELFGLQSYLVNGVRTASRKGGVKANLFQPAAILELIAYHNELKQLNRLREYKWGFLYRNIYSDVRRNAVALFMVELLSKSVKQPEGNPELFHFVEDSFMHLDECSETVMANFPVFFAVHLAGFFGFRIDDTYSERNNILDLREGSFVSERPPHPHFLEEKFASVTSHFLKVMQPHELADIKLNHEFRRALLFSIQQYYALHIQDFGTMKSLPVLREIMS